MSLYTRDELLALRDECTAMRQWYEDGGERWLADQWALREQQWQAKLDAFVPNLDLASALHVSEVCERPDAGTCEKCGAPLDQGCRLTT